MTRRPPTQPKRASRRGPWSGVRAAALGIACAAAISLPAASAHAGRNDFHLASFGSIAEGGGLSLDGDGFQSFAGDLALSLQPKFAGPGSTLGGLGMDMGYELSLTDIDAGSSHWQTAVDDPASSLMASHFYVRKGLPYSFEMGGILTHLHESNVWAVALELKWAFVEGHKYAPDIGVRTHVNTLLGNRDMVMVTSGGSIFISKAFGIGGLIQLTPYGGYQLTFVHARSHVLGRFTAGSLRPTTFILPKQNFLRHRGLLGLRLLAGIADFGFEAALGNVMSYSFKVGLNL